jgi:hypothetical protein
VQVADAATTEVERFSGIVPADLDEVKVGAARAGLAPIDGKALALRAKVGHATACRWLRGVSVSRKTEGRILAALGIAKTTLVPK